MLVIALNGMPPDPLVSQVVGTTIQFASVHLALFRFILKTRLYVLIHTRIVLVVSRSRVARQHLLGLDTQDCQEPPQSGRLALYFVADIVGYPVRGDTLQQAFPGSSYKIHNEFHANY